VLAADGHKLSKQNGAAAIDLTDPAARLQEAAVALGLRSSTPGDAVRQWRALTAQS
jgi:glutamyl-Q tRNA(Asp) synthetase